MLLVLASSELRESVNAQIAGPRSLVFELSLLAGLALVVPQVIKSVSQPPDGINREVGYSPH